MVPPPLPPLPAGPLPLGPPFSAALPPSKLLQLCTTDRQLTLNVINELMGLLGAWLRGEQYHGQHHLRGASSSLRPVGEGLADLIGNTPLVRLASLSEQTGCEVRSPGAGAAAVGLATCAEVWRLLGATLDPRPVQHAGGRRARAPCCPAAPRPQAL